MKLVFISHRVAGDVEENLRKAARWVRWAAVCQEALPIAPYIEYCAALDEHDPAERAQGMHLCRQVLLRCDELWLCGPTISDGMSLERDMATDAGITVVDFTGPDDPFNWEVRHAQVDQTASGPAPGAGRAPEDS